MMMVVLEVVMIFPHVIFGDAAALALQP